MSVLLYIAFSFLFLLFASKSGYDPTDTDWIIISILATGEAVRMGVKK